MNNAIQSALAEQKAKLSIARAKVNELELNIKALESMLKVDAFDEAFAAANATHNVQEVVADEVHPATKELKVNPTPAGRNPKGLLKRIILDALADSEERDLDSLMRIVNARAASEVARSALRTTLMNMKNDGLITSRKAGYYQTSKGESLVAAGLSNTTQPNDGQSIEDLLR